MNALRRPGLRFVVEAALIVERHLVPGRPPHTEYVLTVHGRQLARAVAGLLEKGTEEGRRAL